MRLSKIFPCLLLTSLLAAAAPAAFRIEIVDRENGWPVPLVELRTTHGGVFVTDNRGLVAIDEPDLLGREVWFHLKSHGYGVAADGFGYQGFRCTPSAGGNVRIEVERRIVAKRLGRLTGGGRFAEGTKLGIEAPLPDTGVFGCDSVQLSRYRGGLFWLWGDTTLPHYPLGVFHSTAATTSSRPIGSFEPPLAVDFRLFRGEDDRPRGVAHFPGEGPTWLGGMIDVPDRNGRQRLVATYSKIRNHLDEYETGLCAWNDDSGNFEITQKLWKMDDGRQPPVPRGHPFRWTDPEKRDWILFGDPFPRLRIPADYESWSDPGTWQEIPAPQAPAAADDGRPVEPHRGSVSWNPFRQRWIAVFSQHFGKPAAFGEIWYSESHSPLGPWGPAVKILSHDNYTFYNVRVHPELVPENAKFIVFEGTYTAEFADRPEPTPRYNYNQVLYRLDLDDPKLAPAQP